MEQKPLKYRYVCNPASGTGFNPFLENTVKLLTDRNKIQSDFKFTQKAGDARMFALEAVEQNYSAVIAIGGDGTVNEIASALAHTTTALGIIPRGSGNGLARHLKLIGNAQYIVKELNKNIVKPMDTVVCNEYRFVNLAGIGFEADVAHQFANSKTRGWFNYLRIMLGLWKRSKTQKVKVKADKLELEIEAWQITLANGSQYGNNLYISPKSQLHDGQMELVYLDKPALHNVLGYMWKSIIRSAGGKKLLNRISCKRVELEFEHPTAHVDGEPLLVESLKLQAQLEPNSLHVLVPSNYVASS